MAGDRFNHRSIPIPKLLHDLRFAINHAALISVSDPDGDIIYVNDLFLKVSKFERSEVIGKNHRMFNSGYHPAKFFENLWRTVLSGKVWKGEVRNKAKDGTCFWMDTTIVPFFDRKFNVYQFMCIRSDISRRKEMEQELEAERARRQYFGRLTALGEMAAGIAHEVKNPLTSIKMSVHQLNRFAAALGSKGEEIFKVSGSIAKVIDRIDRIITSVQSLVRNSDFDPFETVALVNIIEDSVDFSRAAMLSKGISLHVDSIPPEWKIVCRPGQIGQVMVNLLNNARDAVENLDDRWIAISVEEKSAVFLIKVTDSGMTISPDIRKQIMDAFFTTKPLGKGTGLGLSISLKIARCHNGRLYLNESSPKTQFVLELPKAI